MRYLDRLREKQTIQLAVHHDHFRLGTDSEFFDEERLKIMERMREEIVLDDQYSATFLNSHR